MTFSIPKVSQIIIAFVFSLCIFFSTASAVSANDYGKQGTAGNLPSLNSPKSGNSYQQKTDYSRDRQSETKQGRSFQKQGSDYQKSQEASSYQQEKDPKQASTYPQKDSGNNSQQK